MKTNRLLRSPWVSRNVSRTAAEAKLDRATINDARQLEDIAQAIHDIGNQLIGCVQYVENVASVSKELLEDPDLPDVIRQRVEDDELLVAMMNQEMREKILRFARLYAYHCGVIDEHPDQTRSRQPTENSSKPEPDTDQSTGLILKGPGGDA